MHLRFNLIWGTLAIYYLAISKQISLLFGVIVWTWNERSICFMFTINRLTIVCVCFCVCRCVSVFDVFHGTLGNLVDTLNNVKQKNILDLANEQHSFVQSVKLKAFINMYDNCFLKISNTSEEMDIYWNEVISAFCNYSVQIKVQKLIF